MVAILQIETFVAFAFDPLLTSGLIADSDFYRIEGINGLTLMNVWVEEMYK